MVSKVNFGEFGECVRLSNGDVEVICSLEFGPRILSYRKLDGENVLGLYFGKEIETELGTFHLAGGHRLWIAPENWPKTYVPDSDPVECVEISENEVEIVQPVDELSKCQKRIRIKLGSGTDVEVGHSVTYLGEGSVELSPWALTIMRGGGQVWIPNEPYGAHGPENLLPNRRWITWPYTDLTDPRFEFSSEGLSVRIEDEFELPQKIGMMNSLGECEYRLDDVTFVKTYPANPGVYPDLGSNTEIFSAGSFVEIETLGELKTLSNGESVDHVEHWRLN